MGKTGWKYTKRAPEKGATNMLKRSNASSKLGRTAPKRNDANMRSADTIKRLKMYSNGKAIRNKEGKIVGGQYMMKDRAGDTKITGGTGRIAPDRRWFGNTRVVKPTELDRFRDEMTSRMADPYSVVLRRKKLPMGLLHDAAELSTRDGGKHGLLENEPFERTFGARSRRKRVKLDQYLVARTDSIDRKNNNSNNSNNNENIKNNDLDGQTKTSDDGIARIGIGGMAKRVPRGPENDEGGYTALLQTARQSSMAYDAVNEREGIVPWGRDSRRERTTGEGIDWRHERKDDLFLKGQSKRIWGEFFKVVDCSDVLLHVIDARNVPGTRCTVIERHISRHASHKHLVFILNKVDLVPNWVAKRWVGILSAVRPTIAFHASMTHAFGKGALLSLLRQFGKLHDDKKQISVGVVGYPNTGKSSVINTLISKKGCKVAPIPGETKIWQYVTLFKRISLIDCPGVVVDTAGDTEVDSVLKGVVRAERLEQPEEFVEAICQRVKREHIAALYGLATAATSTSTTPSSTSTSSPAAPSSCRPPRPRPDTSWKDGTELMERIAIRCGRLLKGGEPCLRSAAIMLINDFQRGRLPHYVAPPELKEEEEDKNHHHDKKDEDDDDTTKSTTTTTETTKTAMATTAAAAAAPKTPSERNGIPGVQQDLDQIGAEKMAGQHEQDDEEETVQDVSDSNMNQEGKAKKKDDDDDDDDDSGGDNDDDDEDDEDDSEEEAPMIAEGEWDD